MFVVSIGFVVYPHSFSLYFSMLAGFQVVLGVLSFVQKFMVFSRGLHAVV